MHEQIAIYLSQFQHAHRYMEVLHDKFRFLRLIYYQNQYQILVNNHNYNQL